MKQFIFIHTVKYLSIALFIYFAMTKYDSLHNPLNQSLWVYMMVYFPAIIGFVNLIHMAFKGLIRKVSNSIKP